MRGDAGVEVAPGHVDGRVRDDGRRLVEEQGPHDDRSLIEDGVGRRRRVALVDDFHHFLFDLDVGLRQRV